MVLLFRKSNKFLQIEISSHYQVIPWVKYVDKLETLPPWEDYKFRVNIWNLGLLRHAPYTYDLALINFLHLHRDRLVIYNLSFMQNVHEYLLRVFIKPKGFTVESISNLNISRHCCGVGFWSKCWARWAAKVSEFYPTVPFDPHLGSVVTLSFWGCFYCLPHILKDIFFTSLCKRHNMLYINVHRNMSLLPWLRN